MDKIITWNRSRDHKKRKEKKQDPACCCQMLTNKNQTSYKGLPF